VDPPPNAGTAPLVARLNGTAERLRAGVSSHAEACSKSELDFLFNEMLAPPGGCKHPPRGGCPGVGVVIARARSLKLARRPVREERDVVAIAACSSQSRSVGRPTPHLHQLIAAVPRAWRLLGSALQDGIMESVPPRNQAWPRNHLLAQRILRGVGFARALGTHARVVLRVRSGAGVLRGRSSVRPGSYF
jgi:hypothetical protein